MKRLLIAILCLVYLASTMGAGLQLHYCMGRLAGWDLGAPAENRCNHCGMDKQPGKTHCCHDDQKWIKGQTDQSAENAAIRVNATPMVAILHRIEWPINDRPNIVLHSFSNHTAPSPPCSVYLMNRVLRL